jgi:uncharacterized protein YggE
MRTEPVYARCMNQKCPKRAILRWMASVLLVCCASLLSTSCLAGRDMPYDGITRVRVVGEASVTAPPDRAVVVVGVANEAVSADEAVAENARRVKAVLVALKKVVGKGGGIESHGYTLGPRYRHQKNGERVLEGYTVSSRIRAESMDVGRAGTIVDAATEAGAGEIQQVRFELRDDRAKRMEALALATARAREKADAMAKALDLVVVRVLSAREGAGHGGPGPMRGQLRSAHMAASPPTTIEPSGIEVRVTVSLEVEVGSE